MTPEDRDALRRSMVEGVLYHAREMLFPDPATHVAGCWYQPPTGPDDEDRTWEGPEVADVAEEVLSEVRRWAAAMTDGGGG